MVAFFGLSRTVASAVLHLAGLCTPHHSAGLVLRLTHRGFARRSLQCMTGLLSAVCMSAACAQQADEASNTRWTDFRVVEGQPEPVPEQWVATQEGEFAHSIKIPNPLPKSSGYRKGMKSEEYFSHLCKTEAGEFIYKTVESVEGFYFMRPPKRPTDDDLKDRYKLEAPEIERLFQLLRDTPTARAQIFVNPPWRLYRFVEEPLRKEDAANRFVRSAGYRQDKWPMSNTSVGTLQSKFALIWRGVKRPRDRELSIAGGEWIIFDLESRDVLAVMRMFGLSPKAQGAPRGIWWLNASQCAGTRTARSAATNSSQLYRFVSRVLQPRREGTQ